MFSHYKIRKSTKGGYYSFTSKKGIIYRCFFTRNISSNDLHGLPLKSSVFTFAFSQKDTTVITGIDYTVGNTVCEILRRFFLKNPEAIIGYICDDHDSKAYKRQLIFNKWFHCHNNDPKKVLIKADLHNVLHAGAIMLTGNSDKLAVQNYFAEQLYQYQHADKTGSVEIVE